MLEVRKRINNRISANRVKLEVRRSTRSAVILALAAVGAVVGAIWILSKVDPNLVSSSRTVSFYVDDATAALPGLDPVRFEGIPAGKITSVKLVNGRPLLTVKIEDKYGPIYKNATATLRPNSALEDMYLDITSRGTQNAGLATGSSPVPAGLTNTAVNVDDVLDTFDTSTRDQLRTLLDNLGNGLADHGAQLQEAFVEALPLVETAGKISRQLALRPQLTKQLVHNASVLTADLGQQNTTLRTLLNYSSQTLGTLQASSGNLKATLAELPGTVNDLTSSLNTTQSVLGRVNTAVKSLYPVADNLGGALSSVSRLATEAKPAVEDLQSPITKLLPLSETLPSLSSSLDTAVKRLFPQVPVLNRAVQDLAQCKAGVEGFFHYDASLTKYFDAHGLVPRGELVVGLQSAGIASPFESAISGCDAGGVIGGTNPDMANAH